MKILLLHQYFLEEDDPGGSRWNEMTKTWQEQGHEIVVLAGMMHYSGFKKRDEYKGKWFKIKHQGKIKVIRCHVSESYNSNFIGRLWGYFSFVFSSIWAGFFKTGKKYDIVVVTSPPLFVGISAYLISKIKRIPFVFEVRDLWPESAIDTGVVKSKIIIKLAYALEKFIYKKAKLINVLTPAFRDTLIEKKNIEKDKIIFIPNAADFTLSDNLLESFDRDSFKKLHQLENKFIITYVGAHGVANHLDQVLDAAQLLTDTNVLFLLIGNGMEKERLIEKSKNLKIENVRFIDSVPKSEVFKYILISDMGASILKKVDTFKTVYSNKTFDYMACKKPILMAIDGVSRKLVEDYKSGVYVEPENTDEYNRIIREYLADKDRLNVEGENGYKYAKMNFDREVLAKKYLLEIEKLIIE